MRTSPAGRRRHLSRELRHLRETTGQTADQVAKRLGWTPSNITHIERNSWKLPKIHHVEALLDIYGVTADTEPKRRAELLDYARQGRARGWWEKHKHLSEATGTYIGLEQEAVTVRIVAPTRIPAILQAGDYARALHRNPVRAEAAAEIVARRQELITGPDPLVVWAIVGEAALRQQVGGPAVQAAQIEHLTRLAALEHVRLFVYPFAAVMPLPNEFVHLSFSDVIDPEAVYIPSAAGETWREEPSQVTTYTTRFETLLGSALTRAKSRRLLTQIATEPG